MAPQSGNNAMIIFDWDDTILPSSFVDKAQADNLSELPQKYHKLFREIEKCTEKCLAAAAKHGEVVIITNSDEGWVKYSAERYLPKLLPVLKNYRIISARTRYEKFYPNQPLCWKAAAFAHEVNEHFCSLEEAHCVLDRECDRSNNGLPGKSDDSVPDMDLVSTDDSSMEDNSISSAELESPGGIWARHPTRTDSGVTASTPTAEVLHSSPPSFRREIVSFGDSIEERTAVKIVSDQLDALPKSVMFLSNPTPTQIIGQLTMLTHHMKFVCEHADDLDLEISSKQAEKCAQGYLARKGMSDPSKKGGTTPPSLLQRILGSSQPQTAPSQSSPVATDGETDMASYVC
ncbi:hypothetical protein ACHAWF_006848 [Thalassiosira exigua]